MKNKYSLICALMVLGIIALFIASCGSAPGGTSGFLDTTPTGGTVTQEKDVDEGDVVKMYGDLIYKLQSDGVTVVKVNKSAMETVGFYPFNEDGLMPKELYVTDSKIVAIYCTALSPRTDFFRYADRESAEIFVTVLEKPEFVFGQNKALGVCYSLRVKGQMLSGRLALSGNDLYIASTLNGVRSDSERVFVEYTENGSTKRSPDFEGLSAQSTPTYPPVVFIRLNIDNLSDNCVIGGLFGASLKDVYMSGSSIIPILTEETRVESESKGCYSYQTFEHNTYAVKLDPVTLKKVDGVCLKDYTVYDRYAVKDFGDTIYITATKNDGSGSTVIALDGKRFSLLNKLEKIAPNEDVKSVAYEEKDGKRFAYVTTFRNVDPLFKIDITNPYAMTAIGYVKITGFSTYMLPVGDRLITVGYDGSGTGADTSKVKISLYSTNGDDVALLNVNREITDVLYCKALTDPRTIFVFENLFGFDAVIRRPSDKGYCYFHFYYLFAIENDQLSLVTSLSNFYGDPQNTTRFYGSVDNFFLREGVNFVMSEGLKFTFSATRARYYDGYLYTVADGLVCAYPVERSNGKWEINFFPEKRLFTTLGVDYNNA